jgi:manganese/zinc/iron transport system permease protein
MQTSIDAALEILNDPTLRTVCLGTSAIGAVSGGLGCFAYLRRQSLIGDVVAHSSLFGIVLFFLISYLLTGQGSKSLFILIPGAIFSGILALWLNQWFISHTRVREDSSLGVMLALLFGAGITLWRFVQSTSPAIPGRRGLEGYLFGMAASMTRGDLIMIAIIAVISIGVATLFWKELKTYSFDEQFCHTIGFRARILDAVLIVLLVNGIVIGIQCIGVVLMIAMLITPAAAARQWSRSLFSMVILAAIFGGMSGAIGTLISASVSNMPTGPLIILTSVLIFVISMLFAPKRGLLTNRHREKGLDMSSDRHAVINSEGT